MVLSPPSPLHVGIIGAGIGGLALAIGLLNQNVPFTLYEATAEFSAVGAGVGLGPNSLKALNMLDSRLKSLYEGIATGNLNEGKDHIMMDAFYIEEGFGSKRGWEGEGWGAPDFERSSAHRKALLDIMTNRIPKSNIRFSKRVRKVHPDGNKVILIFEDGEIVPVSAVVGGDGIRGRTRHAVLDSRYPDHVHPTYAHRYVYRALVPMEDATEILGYDHLGSSIAGDAKMFLGPSSTLSIYPISKGTQVNLVVTKRDEGPWTHQDLSLSISRKQMLEDLNDMDPKLLKLMHWAQPLRWSLFHHHSAPTYINRLICLIGDAAHATTPTQAAGPGQALEDALVLSHLLGLVETNSSVPVATQLKNAFVVYDSIRRPRGNKIVETSQELGEIYNFRDPVLGDDMEKIVENCNQRFAWIWDHDLESEVRTAEDKFKSLNTDGGRIGPLST